MVQTFLITLGVGLILVAVREMIEGQRRRKVVVLVFLAAALCMGLAFVWDFLPAPAPGSLRAGIESAANDFRWWFAVVAAIWIYQVAINILTEVRRNNEILALRNDVQSIAAVIERAVLPRHLTKGQQAAIAGFLSQSQPCDVAFKVIARDAEASSYRADFDTALRKGGWKITKIDYSDDIQEGLRTNFIQATSASQRPDDPKNPKPDRLLQMAIGLAGVRFDGGSGGGGANVTEYLLTIEIGSRRKDSYVVDPPIGLY